MEFRIGNLSISFAKRKTEEPRKPVNNPSALPSSDYIYAPLRTALLPTPAELRYALNAIKSDPRQVLDVIRKLPQAAPHLGGLMGKRQDAVLSLEFEVSPPKLFAEDKNELRKCEEITNRLHKSNFDKLLKNLVNSVLFGHSVTMPHWILDSRNQYYAMFEPIDFIHFTKKDGKIVLIADKRDKDFLITIGDNANLTGANDKNYLAQKLSEQKSNVIFLDIDENTLITSSTNPFEGLERDYIGGWMRPLLYLTLLLHYDILDWAKFNEMYQMPLRVGKYDSFASDKAVDILKTAVKNLGSDAAAVIDKATEIEFVESKSAKDGSGYAKFAEYIENKQSVLIRGETLTTQVDSKGGNRALGEVHMQVGADKLLNDIKTITPVVQKGVIEKDYFFNYGLPPEGIYPKFKIYPKEFKDTERLARIIQNLSSAGLEFSKSWAHEQFGTKAPADEEDKFGGKGSLLL